MKLTKPQQRYMKKLYEIGRLQLGRKRGIPESTANALKRLGLVRIEWLPILTKKPCKFHAFYVLPAYLAVPV